MQRARAAARDQREAARIEAALHADVAHRMQHALLDNAQDAGGRLFGADAQGFRHLLADRAFGACAVERERAARVRAGMQATEIELRIGHRRVFAAEAVAGRAGPRTRALRAHMQHARAIHPRDRAAARTHGVHFHRGDEHVVVADAERVGHVHPPARHQQHIAARAADFHRDQVARAERRADVIQRADAGGGTGERERHRLSQHLVHRGGAAVVLHQQQRLFQSERRQLRLQRTEITREPRRHIRIHRGGGGALVFARQRHDVARHRHGDVRQALAHPCGDFLFVRRIQKTVEKADGDAFHLLRLEHIERAIDRAHVERRHFAAEPVDAFRHRQPQVARHQHRRVRRAVVPGIGPVAAADLEAVAKTLGGEHAGARALALEQDVGGHRGAVHEQRTPAEQHLDRHAAVRGEHAKPGDQPFGGVTRHRGGFHRMQVAPVVGEHHVGEGAAYIDAYMPRSLRARPRSLWARPRSLRTVRRGRRRMGHGGFGLYYEIACAVIRLR